MSKDIFTEPVILEDDRALLRPLSVEDYDLLLPFAMNEPELWKYSMVSPAGADGMKEYIEAALKNKKAQTEYPFIVFDKLSNCWAGSTRFYDIQKDNQTAQLGYTWYGKQFQQTGLNRHCKYLLLEFAFEQWELERVEFRAAAINKKSVDAMKAIGCTVEGILRSHARTFGGGRRNSIVLSILRDEWFGTVRQSLKAKMR